MGLLSLLKRIVTGVTEDEAWDRLIITEGLHVKHDTQIVVMRDMHADKLPQAEADRLRVFTFPDSVLWELTEQDFTNAEAKAELKEQQDYYAWKVKRLKNIVELLDKEAEFRADGKVERIPV